MAETDPQERRQRPAHEVKGKTTMSRHLSRAMAVVLHDLHATGAPIPEVEDSPWQTSPGAGSAFLRADDGSGMGVWVNTDVPEAEQIVMLADQVQEWTIEELARLGQATNWPHCPDHPHQHPLHAVAKEKAMWTCPVNEREVCAIGRIPPQRT